MKHIDLSGKWTFSDNPFPAYRCQLNNRRAKALLMTIRVRPSPAQSTLLPENRFRVVRIPHTNTCTILEGRDNTNRCLLFAGQTGEHVDMGKETTGIVIVEHSDRHNGKDRLEVAVILDIGQTVSFQVTDSICNRIHLMQWNGEQIEQRLLVRQEISADL